MPFADAKNYKKKSYVVTENAVRKEFYSDGVVRESLHGLVKFKPKLVG